MSSKPNLSNIRRESLKELMEALIYYYRVRKVQNMFVDNVTKYLTEKSSLRYCKDEVVANLDMLVASLPEAMSFVQSSLGKILRFQTQIDRDAIFAKINVLEICGDN